jgi:intracellular septation protein
VFKDDHVYQILGHSMSGVDVWIAFKLFIVLPMSGLYAWLLTKWMSRHHL